MASLADRHSDKISALHRSYCGENQTNSVTELSRISLYNVSEGDKTLRQ
jgi:hypothetical protein